MRRRRKRKRSFKEVFFWLPPLVWMGLIFYLSSRQKIAVSPNYWISFAIFKTLHIIEYGVLFILWHFALYRKRSGKKIAAIISILYGISDELHQTFVPTREGRIRDVFIDSLGVFIFWHFVLPWLEKFVLRYNLRQKLKR